MSEVWALIQEAGLIKTAYVQLVIFTNANSFLRGKTPIQSVSCALSQDVLREEESSFERVGKGCYKLKERVTDAELEGYLRTDMEPISHQEQSEEQDYEEERSQR